MGADDIKVLLHLYAERDWLLKVGRLVSGRDQADLMREIVRRQVVVDHLIAVTEETGTAPRPDASR